MKKEYDLKKLKRRPGTPKFDPEAAKIPISIRLDGSVLAALKTEAERLGIPYQTYIGSVLHRFAQGELIDRKTVDLLKQLKVSWRGNEKNTILTKWFSAAVLLREMRLESRFVDCRIDVVTTLLTRRRGHGNHNALRPTPSGIAGTAWIQEPANWRADK